MAFPARFTAHRLLKTGLGVETHLGTDNETGQAVVIKTVEVERVHVSTRLRFEHETAVLRALAISGLRPVLDAGVDGDKLYLVQPFVPGCSLEERLTHGPLGVEATLRVAIDVCAELEAAHEAGISHRDIKPANIVVDTPDGSVADDPTRATLIDFGLARSAWLDGTIRDELVGTVRYLAPEATGAVHAGPDERSDLYALGAVLFECIAGTPPFPGPGVGELLRQHVTAPVPELRRADGAPVPYALQDIIHRLLRKDAAQRYQSARALRDDLTALDVALRAGESDPAMVLGRTDRRRVLADPAFVGRALELETLTRTLERARQGSGAMLLLEAESGGGKSRLLDELAQRANQTDVTVMRGQGEALVAQRPFTVLDGLAAGIAELVQDDPAMRATIVRGLNHHADAVGQALPALVPVLGLSTVEDAGPEQYGEQRNIDALCRLLDVLGRDPRKPCLVILDDCQWADALTVRLLRRWQETVPTPSHLMVVVAFRSEEVPPTHPLRDLPGVLALQLGALPEPAVHALAESMAGPVPADALEVVWRLSSGSPFMAAAVLRGLVECDALVDTAGGWTTDPDALRDVQTARRAAAFLVRRLELLSDDTLALLSSGAVLGKAFELDAALALTPGIAASAAAPALAEATRRRIVWIDERSGTGHFFHDKLREALLDRLGADTRQRLHGQAADALLARSDPNDPSDVTVFDLAYHLDAAGRRAEALPYALRAAELGRTQHALDVAVAHYRMAERAVGSTDGAVEDVPLAARIAEGLGDVLMLQGEYDEAEEELGRAAALVTDDVQSAAIEGKRGEVAFKRGDMQAARHRLEGALAMLGSPVPRTGFGWIVRLVLELLVQAAHTVAPKLFVGRRKDGGSEREMLAIRVYSRLAYLYWFHSGKVHCGWAHLREMNLAERYPPTPELAQAYSEHGPVMTMIPWYSRGLAYAQRSYTIRKELGDVWGQGQSRNFTGVLLYAASRYEEALEACRDAMQLLERTGDRWEVNTAGWNIALALYRLGDLPAAASFAQDVYSAATRIEDSTASGVSLSAWAKAAQGRVPPPLVNAELAHGDSDASTAAEVLLAAALRALAVDDLDAALSRIEEARAVVRRAGLRQEYVAPVSVWWATILRRRAERTPAFARKLQRRRLAQAAKAVRRGRWQAAAYRNNLPHALRESALVAALRGRPGKAVRLAERSIAVAEQQHARYEAAASRVVLAKLRLTGDAESRQALEDARAALAALEPVEVVETLDSEPATPTLSLADRFATLLRVGRTIAAATTVEAVHAGVRDATLALLRGERCHIITLDPTQPDIDAQLVSASDEDLDRVSRTLVAQAVAAGEPAVMDDFGVGESESVLLADVRSVLAAPIAVHGKVVACFYTTHREVGELFGEDEVSLSSFIATLAGAALEHLADSEARFRSLAQNSSDVITLVNRNLVVLDQSAALMRVFGLGPGELVGTSVLSWVHPDDRQRVEDSVRSVLRSRTLDEVRVECRVRHASGAWRHAETVISDLLGDERVQAVVLNTRDITDRRRLEDELRMRALQDPLTGLANRALFLDRLRGALNHAGTGTTNVSVVFLDLDDFKSVNDTLGHGAGDEMLVAVGRRLETCVRGTDTLARLGGDEFAILIEDAPHAEVVRMAGRLLAAASAPVVVDGTEILPHASVGVAHDDATRQAPDDLLARADLAMYAAKARGKHRVEVFHPSMQDALQERARLQSDLARAVGRDQLQLHYQPIVSLGGAASLRAGQPGAVGQTVGMEALLRWHHPNDGLLHPGSFIEVAEDTGLIVALGEWALRTACADLLVFDDLPGHAVRPDGPTGAPLHVSVNVAARQLAEATFVGDVMAVLRDTGLPAEQLILEITESAILEDSAGLLGKLHQMRARGVRIALDDFGTGYSSLTHLRRFPVDFVKIDRSFVAELSSSREDTSIVRSVIELAHALGIVAVAEGVEDQRQLAVLTELGCDLAQGYLWSKPEPIGSVRSRLGVGLPAQRPAPRSEEDRQPLV
ncbi:MAG TPA: EAL domain-containing protein [Mycobacteriales bacterium]|nr:EAL domain-containing protein [Mycobacteriales bacterium]